MKKTIKESNYFKGKQVSASFEITLTKGENIAMKVASVLFVAVILFVFFDCATHGGPRPGVMFGCIGGIIFGMFALIGFIIWKHRGEAKDNMTSYSEDINTFPGKNNNSLGS